MVTSSWSRNTSIQRLQGPFIAGFRREYVDNLPLTLCFIPSCYVNFWFVVSTRRPQRGIVAAEPPTYVPLVDALRASGIYGHRDGSEARYETVRPITRGCCVSLIAIGDHVPRRGYMTDRVLQGLLGEQEEDVLTRNYVVHSCRGGACRGRPFALAKPQRRTLLLRRVRGMTHIRPLAGLALTYAQPPPTNNQL